MTSKVKKLQCPECGGVNLVKFGKKFKKNNETGKRENAQRYQCKDCGRITDNPVVK